MILTVRNIFILKISINHIYSNSLILITFIGRQIKFYPTRRKLNLIHLTIINLVLGYQFLNFLEQSRQKGSDLY